MALDTNVKIGSTVKYRDKDGNSYYRVTKLTKNFVNLGSIFGRTIYHKSVPLSEVTEAHDEWYEIWSKSESYQSM